MRRQRARTLIRRPAVRLIAIVGIVAVAFGVTSVVRHQRDPSCQRTFVPAFFYPGPQWSQATGSSPAPAYLIFNVNSGPGTSPDPTFRSAAAGVRAANVTVLGYITTGYGRRPLAGAEADVRAYRNWYGITSYFLDLAAPGSSELGYYRALVRYIRALNPSASIWLNPGTYPARQYMQLGTVVMVSETSAAGYRSVSVPGWAAGYPADRFAIAIYATPASQLSTVLSLARRRQAGYVFVTNLPGPPADPYGGLPSYWSSETGLVSGSCGG
jgi:hypothetical protein